MAIVPQVNKDEDNFRSHHGVSGSRQWRKTAAKVHATTLEEQDTREPSVDDDDDQLVPELLEEELQVLLTQAQRSGLKWKRPEVSVLVREAKAEVGTNPLKLALSASPSLNNGCHVLLARPTARQCTVTGTPIRSVRLAKRPADR